MTTTGAQPSETEREIKLLAQFINELLRALLIVGARHLYIQTASACRPSPRSPTFQPYVPPWLPPTFTVPHPRHSSFLHPSRVRDPWSHVRCRAGRRWLGARGDGASPCDGATASVSREGATASCKDMIPPTSHEDAASLLVPSPATCKSARVRVSNARGAEVSGVVVVVVVMVGVVVGADASVVVSVRRGQSRGRGPVARA